MPELPSKVPFSGKYGSFSGYFCYLRGPKFTVITHEIWSFFRKQGFSGFFGNPHFRHFLSPSKSRFFLGRFLTSFFSKNGFSLKSRVSPHEFHSNFEFLDAYRAKFSPILLAVLGSKESLKNDKNPPFRPISLGFA
jgi:hypothetical protein